MITWGGLTLFLCIVLFFTFLRNRSNEKTSQAIQHNKMRRNKGKTAAQIESEKAQSFAETGFDPDDD